MNSDQQPIPDGKQTYYAGNTAELTVNFDTQLTAGQFVSSEITFTLSTEHGAEPIITKTEADAGITIIDAENQIATVKVRGNETRGLGKKRGKVYDYEITLRDPNGDISHVVTGAWEIDAASATLN